MQEELQIIDLRKKGYFARLTTTDPQTVLFICHAFRQEGFDTWTTTVKRKPDGKFYFAETGEEFFQ